MPSHLDIAGLLKKRGYKVIKKIGEGSFGKAMLVQSEANNSSLVCKLVDISKATPREREETIKEAKLLSTFKHPYVVRYRESFLESGWLCILMDYCDGGDLSSQIEQAKKRRQPIAEEQILVWLTQAVLGLKHIHERHVLHRDLKSSNFFLTKSGTLKIGDFGIAKSLASTMACARTQIGTPYYLSPEVCEQKPYAWASDIWALGVVLFEMCERRVPFDAPNMPCLFRKICREPTPLIGSGYSDFVRSLCSEMLNKDPRKRPSSGNILAKPRIKDVLQKMLEAHRAVSPQIGAGGVPASVPGVGSPAPARPYREQSPLRRAPSSSPGQGQDPFCMGRDPSPVRIGRDPSPVPAGRDPSPVRIGRDPSPVRFGRDPSPVRFGRDPSPVRIGRDPSPVRISRQPSSRNESPSPAVRHNIAGGFRPPMVPCQLPLQPRRLAAAGGLVAGVGGG